MTSRYVTSTVHRHRSHSNETMACGYEDFIFEEDFDAIMAVLEEDESLEGQFHEAVQEVRV